MSEGSITVKDESQTDQSNPLHEVHEVTPGCSIKEACNMIAHMFKNEIKPEEVQNILKFHSTYDGLQHMLTFEDGNKGTPSQQSSSSGSESSNEDTTDSEDKIIGGYAQRLMYQMYQVKLSQLW